MGAILVAAAFAHAAPDNAAVQGPVAVSRVSGVTVSAEAWTGVRGDALVLRRADGETTVPLDDVIEISLGVAPDPPRAPTPTDVAVDLWSGEVLWGTIAEGDEYALTLSTPLLGALRVEVEAIAGLRFPARLEQATEPPELVTPKDGDVIHLLGGDRIDCTLTGFDATSLVCSTEADDSVRVPYERVTALRLMPTGWKASAPAQFTAVLRDGSRVSGAAPRLAERRLSLDGASGFPVAFAIADAVSVLSRSDRFRYVSDLPAPEVEVDPFWEPVAGDPTAVYAPRSDRAFSGGLLTANGRAWLKGFGVYSGTTLRFELDGKWSEFRTHVAIDDVAGRLGGAIFVIEVDGDERWRSDLVRPARNASGDAGVPGPLDAGRIPVKDAQTLVLRVLPGDERDPYPIQDEADWLGAMLVR